MPKFNFFKKIDKTKYSYLLPNFKKERTQELTTIAITIIALSFFSLFAINPTLSTIAKLKKELEDDKYVQDQLTVKINNLSLLQATYKKIQNDIPPVIQSIPQTAEAPILIAEIQGVANQDNVTLNGSQVLEVEVAKSNQAQGYSSFSFNVSAQGSYESISNFLSDLTKMQRIISLDSVNITKSADTSDSFLLSVSGTAYFKE